VSPLAFRTPAGAARWKRWLLYSPGARILLFALLFALLMAATWGIVAALGWTAKDAVQPFKRAGFLLRQIVPALGAYLLLVFFIERRRPAELAWRRILPGGACGIVAGCALIGTVMAGLWLAGAYPVTAWNPDAPWVGPLLTAGLGTAIAEEIIFRGVLLRISEEGLGSAAALGLSALLFGAVHMGNPNATLWSSLAIALEAGVLLGLVYQVWRSLPVCIGLHLAWNFLEGTVFGSAVSGGAAASSFIVGELRGPGWLTGGVFGIEASVLTVAISLAASLVLLRMARRRGNWVPFRPGRAAAGQPGAADNASIPAGTPC